MGICASCEATAVDSASTAKLILADGELREFERPVKVSYVLEKGSDWFVCDADDMEFDGFVSAVGSDDEMRLGQIYFVLPRTMLRKRLLADELAALAVKASASLMNGTTAPLVFGTKVECAKMAKKGVNAMKNGRGRKFEMELSAIPERKSVM